MNSDTMPFRLLPCSGFVLGTLCLASTAVAEPFSTFEGQRSSHLRVGVSVRGVKINHSFAPVAPLPIPRPAGSPGGPGDVGLFTVSSGTVVYADGSVGLGSDPGIGEAVINDVRQISPTGRTALGLNEPVQRVVFSSSGTAFSDTFADLSPSATIASGEEETAMPYLEWAIPLTDEADGRFLRALLGYGFLSTGSESGPRLVGLQTFETVATTYRYSYDLMGSVSPGTPFPLSTNGTVYFRAHGSYRWMDAVSLSTGGASADVDLSSWEGGVGLGFVLR